MNKKIVFLHIPKTGGSTVYKKLQEIADKNNFNFFRKSRNQHLPNFNFEMYKNKILDNNKTSIFTGHFVFGKDCKEVDLYTLIRNVHKTFFSSLYFHYFRTFKEKNLNIEIMNLIQTNFKIRLNINQNDEVIIKNLLKNNYLVSNPFTKLIAGIPFQKFFFIKQDIKINDRDYKIAINNLKYFKFIGRVENINEFFLFLNKLYNFNITKYKNQNVGRLDRNEIDRLIKKLYHQISDYNKYDIKLTEIIKDKYNKKNYLF